jgi:sugar lactone lactonase YvrE
VSPLVHAKEESIQEDIMCHKTRNVTSLAALFVSVLLFVTASNAQVESTVVAEGLNTPMGVLTDPDGGILVVEFGVGGEEEVELDSPFSGEPTTYRYGMSSRILRFDDDGESTVVANLPSLYVSNLESVGGNRLAIIDGDLYATVGGYQEDPDRLTNMSVVVKIVDGEAIKVAGLLEFEVENNPDSLHIECNPYGLAAGPDGKLWVTDAAGNDLLKVDPLSGKIEVVAVFDALPSPIPNAHREGRMETDPVPTSLTFDNEGNAYVSMLSGLPFAPGSAKVVKVAPDGERTDYATGLTMLTDIRTAPDGHMYAVSFGQFTAEGPVPNSGSIIRIGEGESSEEVVAGLGFPTSLDFNASGDAFVTVVNSLGEPGIGQVVRYDGLGAAE